MSHGGLLVETVTIMLSPPVRGQVLQFRGRIPVNNLDIENIEDGTGNPCVNPFAHPLLQSPSHSPSILPSLSRPPSLSLPPSLPPSGLSNQWYSGGAQLEGSEHCQEQMVCSHRQDTGGERGLDGGHEEGARKEKAYVLPLN